MVPPCGTLSAIIRTSTVISVWSQLSSFIGVRDRSARLFTSVDEDVRTRARTSVFKFGKWTHERCTCGPSGRHDWPVSAPASIARIEIRVILLTPGLRPLGGPVPRLCRPRSGPGASGLALRALLHLKPGDWVSDPRPLTRECGRIHRTFTHPLLDPGVPPIRPARA
jgi:hypothetical protein